VAEGLRRGGLNEQIQAPLAAVHLEEHRQRDHHEVVLGLAEHAAQLLAHADDPERHVSDLQVFAHRILAGKEPLPDVPADDTHPARELRFLLGEKASVHQLARADVDHVGGRAIDAAVLYVFVAEADGAAHAGLRAHPHGPAGVVPDKQVILPGDVFPTERFDHLVDPLGDVGHLGDLKDIAAEVGDLVGHVVRGALDDRHDRDERRDADGDPQHREKRPQQVFAHHAYRLAEQIGYVHTLGHWHGSPPIRAPVYTKRAPMRLLFAQHRFDLPPGAGRDRRLFPGAVL